MNLKIGEQVFVTDEDLKGEVISFTENEVVFVCEDGFDYTFPINEVYKFDAAGNAESKMVKQIFEFDSAPKSPSKNAFTLRFNIKNPVFDLHIEQLDYSKTKLPHYEVLQFQMSVVEEILFQANRKRVRKLVLVHGVGEGKLRKEIRGYLKQKHPEVEFLDANYQKFGAGATELIIHQFDSFS